MRFAVVHFSVLNIMLDLFFDMNTILITYIIHSNRNSPNNDSFMNAIDLEIKISHELFIELFMNYSNNS